MWFPIPLTTHLEVGWRRVGSFCIALLMVSPLPALAQTLSSDSLAFSSSSPSTPQTLGTDFGSYILGAGDKLDLSFLSSGNANLGGSFQLLNDGSTTLPLIGSVVLDGLTVSQANRWLISLYRRFLRQPELTLRVAQPRPLQISVVGEVENPGLYLLNPGGEGSGVEGKISSIPGLPTVVSALQKAGGITLNANLRNVLLQRRLPGGRTQLMQTHLDLAALLQKGDKLQNPFLFDGDTIIIGRTSTPQPNEVLELAAANLSPETISVNVVGEVKSPGRLQLRAGTPLLQALLAAGGPTPMRSNRNNVELVRINRDGTATLRRFVIDYQQGVSGPRNPPLRDGDSVVVNRSVLAAGSDALNAFTQPITGLVNILALVRILQNVGGNNN
ncbi:MAG: hypothetical protein RLZZ609_1424 [Cyanobacteriota bacterium]